MSLRVENISKHFGPKPALRGVTLEARDGEFVVLLGPSGCGKSTLLRIIAGLEEADEGSVILAGRDITRVEPRRRDVAMVFQGYALYPHMTVAQNIGFPLRVRKRPPPEISAEVERVAARLGLAHLLTNLPKQLSGGERQRVALARAIVRHPQAFLMDEPLSNLDSRLRIDMRAELKHLQHELGVVTIYVTHDQVEAMTLASRIAVLKDGVLQQFDTPSEIYRHPANLFVAGFVGNPSMNLLPCSRLSVGLSPPAGEVTLGIRPEDIDFSPTPQPGWTEARVWVTEDLGNETLIRLTVDDAILTVRAPSGTRADFDSLAWFRIRREQIHWFDSQTTNAIR
jgi:multiple sugar transport system ATP-binding protein